MTIPMLHEAEELIEKTISKFKKPVIACSFGKDSMVVSHIARRIDPDILHVNYASSADFPETRRFKQECVEKLGINLIELKPYKDKTFWQCVAEYGLPTMRTSERTGTSHSPKCCYYLKERPMQVFVRKEGVDAIMTGMTAAESWNRYKLAYRYSNTRKCPALVAIQEMTYDGWSFCAQRYWSKTWASWQVHPLMTWTEQDVWDYTKQEDIPVNPVYEKWHGIHNRVGCLPCTAYTDWERNLRVSHPKLYKMLKEIEGTDDVLQTTLWSD